MNTELAFVLLLLAVTIVMFALNRPRMDAVALIMMTVLPLTGVITVSDALAGFSDPNVVLIAALFVIGEGLVRTGVAQRLGDLLVRRAGTSESRLIALLMVVVTGFGSVMSSTGIVAIFIPAALRIGRKLNIPAGRLMMPISVAALISGMITLIATAPNLVVHSQLVRAGYAGFNFFSFTPFGLPILMLAIGYMLFARRWLAPVTSTSAKGASRPNLAQWIDEYHLAKREYRLRVTPDSPWIGKRLEELQLRALYGMNILAIERQKRFRTEVVEPSAQSALQVGDVLFVDVRERPEDIDEICRRFGLYRLSLPESSFSDRSQTIGMAELLVPPTSDLVGETLISARFRSLCKLSVIGIKRGTTAIEESVQAERLRIGDTLLVAGPWRAIIKLMNNPQEVIVLNLPVELDDVIDEPTRAPFALGTLAIVVAMMVTGVVPNVQAALIGCLLLGLFRCVDMNIAYRSIQWQTLFLIVGMFPFALALEQTGGVNMAVQALMGAFGGAGPSTMLASLFVLTAVLGLFISNTATAVLMAPIALAIAAELGLSPYPFAMIVALAASAAFMTPVSSPVNALVVGPGKYQFLDFVRVGVPFTLIVMLVCVVLVPVLLPFVP